MAIGTPPLSHTNEKTYSCFECGVPFVPELPPVAHGRSHTGEKLYWCSVCEEELLSHGKNSHCGRQLYSSSECVTCFVNNTELLSHWKSHTDEKTYSCSECGKCFSPDPPVVTHEKSRTCEGLYLCSECEKISDYHIYTLFQNPESDTGRSSTLVSDQVKSVGMR
ncbi:gastrula zinc finger protein XlCGF71.1-like [Hyperolius riggenbachi]|uniref:gastrula zinc finger protein XlCGF71.1-like n=1 Tax=Hyperolius riggenbachi TaxID=752182 RepID=UPI0035A31C9B